MFYDDTFILRLKRVRAICKHLKRLGIIWRCFVRADLIMRHGRALVEQMADSGCVEVGMGVESGSDTILKNIQKGETVADIRGAVTLLDTCGIRVKGLFIVGLPGESRDTLHETQQLVRELPFAESEFTILQPYAGSPIYEKRHEYDVGWDTLPDTHYKGRPGEYRCAVHTSSLTSGDIVAARDELEGVT
jgi:anaerobic magnesium-protoporphyrin IX monomethyl ester cyclase